MGIASCGKFHLFHSLSINTCINAHPACSYILSMNHLFVDLLTKMDQPPAAMKLCTVDYRGFAHRIVPNGQFQAFTPNKRPIFSGKPQHAPPGLYEPNNSKAISHVQLVTTTSKQEAIYPDHCYVKTEFEITWPSGTHDDSYIMTQDRHDIFSDIEVKLNNDEYRMKNSYSNQKKN